MLSDPGYLSARRAQIVKRVSHVYLARQPACSIQYAARSTKATHLQAVGSHAVADVLCSNSCIAWLIPCFSLVLLLQVARQGP